MIAVSAERSRTCIGIQLMLAGRCRRLFFWYLSHDRKAKTPAHNAKRPYDVTPAIPIKWLDNDNLAKCPY